MFAVTLGQISGIFAVAAVAGGVLAIVLSRGLREALTVANEGVKTLLTDRDIERERHARQVAELEKQLAACRSRESVLTGEVVDSIVDALESSTHSHKRPQRSRPKASW